jgi:hypothetical protein
MLTCTKERDLHIQSTFHPPLVVIISRGSSGRNAEPISFLDGKKMLMLSNKNNKDCLYSTLWKVENEIISLKFTEGSILFSVAEKSKDNKKIMTNDRWSNVTFVYCRLRKNNRRSNR